MGPNLGGQPPIFKDPEEMRMKILEYFEWIKGDLNAPEDMVTKGAYKRYPENVTITGLCLYLGFESRQSFYDYEKRDGFSYIVKHARMRVENGYENKLLDAKNPTGPIFALKNMGWTDRQEIDQKTEHSGSVTHTIDHSKLSDAALREIASLNQPPPGKD